MMRTEMRAALMVVVALSSPALSGCTDSHSGGDAGGTDTGGGSFDLCEVSSECVVVPVSCCGSCGAATRGDAIAINSDQAGAHRMSVCGPMGDCPACYMPQDPTLVATCNAGRCEIVDLRDDDIAACAEASDCRIRTKDCCECGGDTSMEGLIAIPRESENAYMELVCDEGMFTGCPECAPIYPPEASATCVDGFCAVVWSSP